MRYLPSCMYPIINLEALDSYLKNAQSINK